MHSIDVNRLAMVQREWTILRHTTSIFTVKELIIESAPAIVPLNNKVIPLEKIEISDGEISIALSADMNIEALSEIIRVLKKAQ